MFYERPHYNPHTWHWHVGFIFSDYGALQGKWHCFNLKGGSPRSAPASPSGQLFAAVAIEYPCYFAAVAGLLHDIIEL